MSNNKRIRKKIRFSIPLWWYKFYSRLYPAIHGVVARGGEVFESSKTMGSSKEEHSWFSSKLGIDVEGEVGSSPLILAFSLLSSDDISNVYILFDDFASGWMIPNTSKIISWDNEILQIKAPQLVPYNTWIVPYKNTFDCSQF